MSVEALKFLALLTFKQNCYLNNFVFITEVQIKFVYFAFYVFIFIKNKLLRKIKFLKIYNTSGLFNCDDVARWS